MESAIEDQAQQATELPVDAVESVDGGAHAMVERVGVAGGDVVGEALDVFWEGFDDARPIDRVEGGARGERGVSLIGVGGGARRRRTRDVGVGWQRGVVSRRGEALGGDRFGGAPRRERLAGDAAGELDGPAPEGRNPAWAAEAERHLGLAVDGATALGAFVEGGVDGETGAGRERRRGCRKGRGRRCNRRRRDPERQRRSWNRRRGDLIIYPPALSGLADHGLESAHRTIAGDRKPRGFRLRARDGDQQACLRPRERALVERGGEPRQLAQRADNLGGGLQLSPREAETLARVVVDAHEAEGMLRAATEEVRRERAEHTAAA